MHHPREEFYRLQQFLQALVLDYFTALGWFSQFTSVQFISSESRYSYASSSEYSDWCKLKVYNSDQIDLRSFSEWRMDVKSGIKSEARFVGNIKNQDFESVGDYRYVSQLNRLHHIPFLLLIKEGVDVNHNLDIVAKHIDSWKVQNPFLKSINWKSGIEVGIRAVNLFFAQDILSGLPKSQRVSHIVSEIENLQSQNLHYLLRHRSLYSSANNHLLFELLGIATIATSHNYKDNGKHTEYAVNQLIKELSLQVHEDGFTKEQSTCYHAEVLNIYITLIAILKKYGKSVDKAAEEKVILMGEVLQKFMFSETTIWPIGDSDEGQILFPYYDSKFNLYRSLLFDTWKVSGRKSIGTDNYQPDLRNNLLWSKDEYNKAPITTKQTTSNSKECLVSDILKQSGYLFVKDERCNFVFDFGSLGFGSLAAHGHSDVLQILLAVDEIPFIIDPGTYQYHSKYAKFRNYFRGASAHNTITIKGMDQSKSGGRMLWSTTPEVRMTKYLEDDSMVLCTAEHNGFVLQNTDVIHERSVMFHKTNGRIELIDHLICNSDKPQTLEFNLHFNGSVEVEKTNEIVHLSHQEITVTCSNEIFRDAKLHYNENLNPGLGLQSTRFDSLKSCYTLSAEFNFVEDVLLTTTINVNS